MFCEMIDDAFLVSMSGTSEGTQIKYYKDGYWYKKDSFGGEATAEYLSSRLLTFSDLSAGDYVTYECGNLNGASACRSRNFLQEGESFITLYRFYQLSEGRKINEDLLRYETPEKRADFVLTYFSKNCALDLSEYFSRIFLSKFEGDLRVCIGGGGSAGGVPRFLTPWGGHSYRFYPPC